jgi:hypothetical protein
MANKFIQGKEGEALAYPKTLAEAVFLEENGEAIKERLVHLLVSENVTATAICELDEAIKLLRSGMVNHGKVLTAKDVENNLNGNTGLVLSAAQGKVIADYIDRLEQTVATAICELDAYKALSRAIAPEYKLKPYTLDELCMHDGMLYRCVTAITNPEVWTPAHWEVTDIVSIINS